ncbi:MAG: alcohol dehydrogenase catalytic domain-containing protein, partial [Anaerolineaceae bacterium]|nr:alcohol dehydrogenase catalytic domain-containing protein [Anaerolineaceae bacterium]
MKAMIHTRYGNPDEALHPDEVEQPVPGANKVLVKILAASINYGDKALVKGKPFLVRLMGYGLFKPIHRVPGGDIAGVVESVGADVTEFMPGD